MSTSTWLLVFALTGAMLGCVNRGPAASNTVGLGNATGGAGGAAGTDRGGGRGGAGGTGGTFGDPGDRPRNSCNGVAGWYPAPVLPDSSADCPPCAPPGYVDGGTTACTREGLRCLYLDTKHGGLGADCDCAPRGPLTPDGGRELRWHCVL